MKHRPPARPSLSSRAREGVTIVAGHSGWRDGQLGDFVRSYIERVVNQRDVTAVEEMVSPDYVGRGPEWAADIEELRQFYLAQARDRPDWHIEVQDSIELGDSVVVRAVAGGAVMVDGVIRRKTLEWLTHYRVVDGRIAEINILSVVQLGLD